MEGAFIWNRSLERKEEWQLSEGSKVIVKVIISYGHTDKVLGSYSNHDFLIESKPQRIPYNWRNKKENLRIYSIKLMGNAEIGAEKIEREWGLIEDRYDLKINPTRLILSDGRTYNIMYDFQPMSKYRDYFFYTSNPGDEGRLIGKTRRARNDKDSSSFELIQFKDSDPPFELVALVSFYFSTVLHYYKDYGL
jgi:hypothetical protein